MPIPTFEQAKKRAIAMLHQYNLPERLPELHTIGIQKTRSLLGGSHSVVTYPPLDSLYPVQTEEIVRSLTHKSTHLYIHIPFCETRCTFCHYVVALYKGEKRDTSKMIDAVSRYLDILSKEMKYYADLLKDRRSLIASLYIGGGTPMILSIRQLQSLFENAHSSFSFEPNAPICMEASPLTLLESDGRKKLSILQECGVTRLSFGIQSFDNAVLQYAGRGYSTETAVQACTLAKEYFDNWNIDLIQSLFQGSLEEIWLNLSYIAKLHPPHITWYNGRFDSSRPQGIFRKTQTNEFETEWGSLVGRVMIWQTLQELGYTQIDGNRFVLADKYTDNFKAVRTSISSQLIGLGVSSYSHSDDWFFRNEKYIPNYIDRTLSETLPPIATGRKLTPEEKIAGSYVTGLRNIWYEDEQFKKFFTLSSIIYHHYRSLINRLLEHGIIEQYTDTAVKLPGLRLTFLGRLFEDEVLALFYSPSVQKMIRKKIISFL